MNIFWPASFEVSLALLDRIQPILERLKENITKPWRPSFIDKSKWCKHWYLFKFKRLVILNVHDVKVQSINEQEHAFLERCVNSILYLHKKYQKCHSKVWTYCSTCTSTFTSSTSTFTRIVQIVLCWIHQI